MMGTPMKRTVGLVVAAVLVLIGVGVVAFRGSPTRGGGTDPKTFALPALHGSGQVRLADFRGKPTVVHFFASWCSACDAELPEFTSRAIALKGRVNFIGVDSLETGDKDLLVKRYHLDTAFTALPATSVARRTTDCTQRWVAASGCRSRRSSTPTASCWTSRRRPSRTAPSTGGWTSCSASRTSELSGWRCLLGCNACPATS
jgi:thiol-disulfide isomerase/thioredoxin